MAQFCTKCGSPIPEGMRFCTGCGASMDGPPAAPVMAAPVPASAMAAPMPGAPVQPAKSGSSAMKIILIIVAVIIFLMLISAASCMYMIYRGKQAARRFEKQAQITFPASPTMPSTPGSPSILPNMQTGAAVDTGIPVYPGAESSGAGAQMSMGAGTVKTQSYLTSDSADKVVAFYKDKLGSSAMVMSSQEGTTIQQAGPTGIVTINIAPDQASGKIRISVNNITK